MKLNFAKISPTQNMTIIVSDPVPRSEHARIAAELMAYGSVGAEQVGFLENPSLPGARARLQMMGGEFCGNATMSLAALLAHQDGLADGDELICPLEISGAEGLVNCRIARCGDAYIGSVSMPLPGSFGTVDDYPAVFFDGIAHVIVPEHEMSAEKAQEKISSWCDALNMDALGILLVNEDKSAFRPLVYVRETGSAVWEHGCGSGTAAIGAHAAMQAQADASLSLSQPGGTMRAEARYQDGRITGIEISGTVRIAATGTAWIPDPI